jgi:hypothetical protein
LLTLFGKINYFTTILLKTKFQDCFTSLMWRNLLMNQIRYSEKNITTAFCNRNKCNCYIWLCLLFSILLIILKRPLKKLAVSVFVYRYRLKLKISSNGPLLDLTVTKCEVISGDLSHSKLSANIHNFESDVVSNFHPGKTNTEYWYFHDFEDKYGVVHIADKFNKYGVVHIADR